MCGCLKPLAFKRSLAITFCSTSPIIFGYFGKRCLSKHYLATVCAQKFVNPKVGNALDGQSFATNA